MQHILYFWRTAIWFVRNMEIFRGTIQRVLTSQWKKKLDSGDESYVQQALYRNSSMIKRLILTHLQTSMYKASVGEGLFSA